MSLSKLKLIHTTVNYWTVACVILMPSLRLPINYAFLFLSRRHHIKLAMIISFQSIILHSSSSRPAYKRVFVYTLVKLYNTANL